MLLDSAKEGFDAQRQFAIELTRHSRNRREAEAYDDELQPTRRRQGTQAGKVQGGAPLGVARDAKAKKHRRDRGQG